MSETPPKDAKTIEPSALGHLAQRLRSQPLVFALGLLLLLANLAIASIEGLRLLLPAAVAVFVIAVAAWVIVEIMRFRRLTSANIKGERVRVSARDVGETGEVFGIDDASETPSATSADVNLKAERVDGSVVGIRRGPRQK